MSSFSVSVETLTITPHPNADRLELANVGLYSAVVGKGQFSTGQDALYIPEQAVVPDWLISELGLDGKLAGKNKDRVKAVRLRGVLSQGIVAPLSVLDKVPTGPVAFTKDTQNYADALGVVKWEPEIPASMGGEVRGETGMLRWTDIENIQRYPHIFDAGEDVILTEKVHGTCLVTTTFFESEGERTEVISKGLAGKNLAFIEDEKNLYWQAVRKNKVVELAREIRKMMEAITQSKIEAVGIYGEVFGAGIQDLTYGRKNTERDVVVFDAQIRFVGGMTQWVDTDVLRSATTDIRHVPIIWRGAFDINKVAEVAAGKEQVSGTESNIREGVVIRPVDASLTWADGHSARRKIAKFVTEEYLTRKNGTEYN